MHIEIKDPTPTVSHSTSAGLAAAACADQERWAHALMPIVERPPLVMDRGQGSYLWDEAGTRYLDFIQGWAVNALGHSPQLVVDALASQASRLLTASPAFHTRPQLELARLLVPLCGGHAATFVNSGAEANETAIKLARKWGKLHKRGAFEVLTTRNGFHGRTLATMAASGKPGWEAMFPPYPDGFRKVDFGDSAAFEQAIGERTVAIMVEPVQGEAGVVVPDDHYLRDLRELCDRHDLLLIADEVQTGVGRTGRWLAQEHTGVRADITTLGKGLGAGVPIAAVVANERAQCFEPNDHGSTFGGNPLMTAVALQVVRTISSPAFLSEVLARGHELESVLTELCAELWGESAHTRGSGLLRAIVFDRPLALELTQAARECGLLLNAARPNIVRFMPQLAVSSAEIQEMADRLRLASRQLGC